MPAKSDEARARQRERRQSPEYKAREHLRRQTPEYKARERLRRQTPEYKARMSLYKKIYIWRPGNRARARAAQEKYRDKKKEDLEVSYCLQALMFLSKMGG